MDGKEVKGKSLAVILLVVFLLFFCIFRFAYPVNYHNLGHNGNSGGHSWLSGSTLKFVNEWLSEGAVKNHFTCYESFDSIEFRNASERTPYLSYPAGSTFLVFSAAKILGKDRIDISFLKHFQMVLYCMEALLFAAFLYLFTCGIGMLSEVQKILIAVSMAAVWILLPENVYYLSNVFFADQCIILWVMLFLLLEYISHMEQMDKARLAANLLKCPVIYIGVLTDYYFWILVFVAFLLQFIRNMILKKRLLQNIKEALWYVCPVMAALLTFLWQLSYTEGWIDSLLGIFLFRTGGLEEGNVYVRILINFYGAFADASKKKLILLLVTEGAMAALAFWSILKKKKWKQLFLENQYSILVLGFVSPALQIFFLKNHSAIHEFSMLKAGWPVVMSILVIALLLKGYAGKGASYFCAVYLVAFAAIAALTGVPVSAHKFISYRYAEKEYLLEEILYETMNYENVCFSLTYSIPFNPPHQLSVSEKQVYLVESLDEVDTYFTDLPEQAVKVLIIEKDKPDKSEYILEMENITKEQNPLIFEDDSYCFVQLKNY